MALSFIQWEKYIQGFPDDRLGQEFQDPGSTVAGPEKPPQAIIIATMGERTAAREADAAVLANQNQPNGTIAEQTYSEFAGEDRPVGGPGGGPPAGGPPPGGPGGSPPGGPPMGPGGPPMGGPPMGGPPMGGPPMGGPPMGGPPMGPGGPPMMADGGFIPGYQAGGDTEDPGFLSGLGSFLTGAGSLEEARDKPLRTLGRSAFSTAMMHPGARLAGGAGRFGLGLLGLGKGSGVLSAIGRGTVGMGGKGGIRGYLARLLAGKKRMRQYGPREGRISVPRRIPGSVKEGRAAVRETTRWPKGHPKAGQIKPGAKLGTLDERLKAVRASRISNEAIGRAAVLRGGGLGVAGLLALDPLGGPEPTPEDKSTTKAPNTNLANSSAIRADRSKERAYEGYGWVNEEGPSRRDLRQLIEHRERGIARGDFERDFQDMVNQEWMAKYGMGSGRPGYVAPRQGYATLPEIASGGIAGLGFHEGGNIPIHTHGSGPGQHLVTQVPSTQAQGVRRPPPQNPEEFKEYKALKRKINDARQSQVSMSLSPTGPPESVADELARRWQERQTASDVGFWRGQTAPTTTADVAMKEVAARRKADELARRWQETQTAKGKSAAVWDAYWEADNRRRRDAIPDEIGAPEGEDDTERIPGDYAYPSDIPERATLEAKDHEDWLRTRTSAESKQDDYWARRRQREKDNAFGLLGAGVAEAISGSGGIRGNIGKGLAKATREQIEHGRLISDYEGLPITAAAARSRASTFEAQQGILKDVYSALMSRGEVDATIQGRIDELQDSLAASGRMTPDNMARWVEILQYAQGVGAMSVPQIKDAMEQLTAMGMLTAGISPLT
tara:strand:- start:299 stop:2812 length:2514 start_codon:yes stop_codon:yes gene_type:complete